MRSIRTKITLAFLTLVLVGLGIVWLSIAQFGKASRMREVTAQVDQVLIGGLTMQRLEQDFYAFDLIDPEFYQTRNSPHLEKHLLILRQVRKSLESLESDPEYASLDLGAQTVRAASETIRLRLAEYRSELEKFADLQLQRGFKDHGLVGAMRESAHEIEAQPAGLPLAELLMLRRHEKDYIIRKDTQYARRLEAKAAELTGQLKRSTHPQATQTLAHLRQYRESFADLVRLETRMGLNNEQGVRQKIRETSARLFATTEDLSHRMGAEMDRIREQQLAVFSLLAGLALGMGILFSILFSEHITRPIRNLTLAIRKTVESDFGKEIHFEAPENPDEIGILARDFSLLQIELHKRLGEIENQSRSLREKNQTLQLLNDQLSLSWQELERSNKVKDKMFSIVSHDFRAPLQGLQAYLELLEKNALEFQPEQMQKFARDIGEKVRALSTTLENTLRWSQYQSGQLVFQPEWIYAAEITRRVLSLYEDQAAHKSIRLEASVAPPLRAWADPGMLEFILRNLLSNAIKFSPRGTTVTITGQVLREGAFGMVVEDQGKGMSPEEIRLVLSEDGHLSTTGTENESGTGLGLRLCKDFLDANGGKLELTSEPGKGTRALVILAPGPQHLHPEKVFGNLRRQRLQKPQAPGSHK